MSPSPLSPHPPCPRLLTHPVRGPLCPLGHRVGCVALRGREKDSYVVAAGTRLGLLDWDSQQVTWVAQLDRHRPHNRFNDGKADPAGRFVAGGHRRDYGHMVTKVVVGLGCGGLRIQVLLHGDRDPVALPRPLPLPILPPLGQTHPTPAEISGTPSHPDGSQSSVSQDLPGLSTPRLTRPGLSTPRLSTAGLSTSRFRIPGLSSPRLSTAFSTPGLSSDRLAD